MANVIGNEIREGRVVLIYDSGLERWADTGHIIKPPSDVLITPEISSEYQRRKKEQRRAVAIAAANNGVHKKELLQQYGQDAFIAAVVDSAMVKAQNPKDPKQIEAARFVMSETGVSVESDNGSNDDPNGAKQSRVLLLIAEINKRNDSPKVIEGIVTDV